MGLFPSRRQILLFFMVAFSIVRSPAQVLPFHYYTTKDGLISNQINVLFQDSHGYLWIGTNNGLSVYDGASFTNYTTVNGLVNNNVTSITERRTRPGVLYIATIQGGVSEFENGRFTTIPVGAAKPPAAVTRIAVDTDDTVWCINGEGMFKLNGKTAIPINFGIPHPISTFDLYLQQNVAWIVNDSDVYRCPTDSEQPSARNRKIHLTSEVLYINGDSQGNVWVSTLDSVLYEIHDLAHVRQRKVAEGHPLFIRDDGQGALWISSENGLLKLSGKTVESDPVVRYSLENGLAEALAGPLLIDRENNLWIGGWSTGLAKLSERNLYHIPTDYAAMNSMAVGDSNGHLWIASPDGVWEIFTKQNGQRGKFLHRISGNHKHESVHFVNVDPEGHLWVKLNSVSATLQCYSIDPCAGQESRLVLQAFPELAADPGQITIQTMLVDRQHRLWYTAEPLGVVVFDLTTRQRKRVYTIADGLPDNSVRTMFQDQDGNVWLGGFSGGLSWMDARKPMNEKLQKFTTEDGLPDNGIRSIGQDSHGRLWIGTRYGGLALYHDSHFQTISMRDGLQSNAIWSLSVDERDRVWLGTDVGLECVTQSSAAPVHVNNELLGSRVLSCGVFHDKFVWFVTLEGATIYEYAHEVSNIVAPPVYIKSFQVNGQPFGVDHLPELLHDQNNCTIEYVGLSFKDEHSVRYQYRLGGVDTAWLPPTSQHAVTYATLQPGNYRFEVRAINNDGVMSSSPASLQFTVIPPYWNRWWFYALVASISGGILVLGYRYRINKLLEIERLRVRIASDLHDDVGSTLTRIAVHSEVIQTTTNPDKIISSSKEIGEMSREIISTLSDIVWSIDARHDTLGNLIDRIRAFALDVLSLKDIHVKFETLGLNLAKTIPADVRQNIYLIVKEAVNNIAKHSRAREVAMRFELRTEELVIVIADNGSGLPEEIKRPGHGLSNMRMRAERIGGTLVFDSSRGLTMTLTARI